MCEEEFPLTFWSMYFFISGCIKVYAGRQLWLSSTAFHLSHILSNSKVQIAIWIRIRIPWIVEDFEIRWVKVLKPAASRRKESHNRENGCGEKAQGDVLMACLLSF